MVLYSLSLSGCKSPKLVWANRKKMKEISDKGLGVPQPPMNLQSVWTEDIFLCLSLSLFLSFLSPASPYRKMEVYGCLTAFNFVLCLCS